MSVAQTSLDLLSRLGSKGPDISALTQLAKDKPEVDFDEVFAQQKTESKDKPERAPDKDARDEVPVKAADDKPEDKVAAKDNNKADEDLINKDKAQNDESEAPEQEASSDHEKTDKKEKGDREGDKEPAKEAQANDEQEGEEESQALAAGEPAQEAPAEGAQPDIARPAGSDPSLVHLDGLGALNPRGTVVDEIETSIKGTTIGLGPIDPKTQLPPTAAQSTAPGLAQAAAKANPASTLGVDPGASANPEVIVDPALLAKSDVGNLASSLAQTLGPRGATGAPIEPLPQSAKPAGGLGALLPSAAGLPPLEQAQETALSAAPGLALESAQASQPKPLTPGDLRAAVNEGAADNKATDEGLLRASAAKAGPSPALVAQSSAASDVLAQASAGKESTASSTSSSTAIEGPRVAGANLAQFQTGAMKGATVQTQVQTPMNQPQWGSAVANKVLWMAAQNLTSAEIHLDPPELGQMMVRVTVSQDQASVTFTTPNVAVREALDQNAFRLREQFEAEGLDLVNVDVGEQNLDQQGEAQEEGADASLAGGAAGEQDEETTLPMAAPKGLVDYFV